MKFNRDNWRKWKVGFKILLVMVALALIIKFLMDVHHDHVALLHTIDSQKHDLMAIKKHVNDLQQSNALLIHDLNHANAQLQTQQNQIHTLQQQAPKLHINHKPVSMTVDQVKSEVSASTGVKVGGAVLGLDVIRQIGMTLLRTVLIP